MKLHANERGFKEAVEAAAEHFGIRAVFVEKDYWVTVVLKELSISKHCDYVVFKGGTSISKAYGVAKRFSEDVDLALIPNEETSVETNAQLMADIEQAIAKLPLVEKPELRIISRNKFYRQTHWEYPKAMPGKYDPATDKLKIEFVSNANVEPHSLMRVQSFVAEFFEQTGRNAEIDEFELHPVSVKVLSHKRTFAEKVVAIANAGLAEDGNAKLKKQIRHLYDLTLLWRDPEIAKFVKSEMFGRMVDEAREGDKLIPDLKEVASKPWKTSIIFDQAKKTLKDLKLTYEKQLGPLVFDSKAMPKISEIEKMLNAVCGRSQPKKKKKAKTKRSN